VANVSDVGEKGFRGPWWYVPLWGPPRGKRAINHGGIGKARSAGLSILNGEKKFLFKKRGKETSLEEGEREKNSLITLSSKKETYLVRGGKKI